MSVNQELMKNDDIYRMGVIGQFHLTFELAWKAIKEQLDAHGVELLAPGSPREVIKKGFAVGIVDDEAIWLDMLKNRNISIHVYDEDKAQNLIQRIFTEYVEEYLRLQHKLAENL